MSSLSENTVSDPRPSDRRFHTIVVHVENKAGVLARVAGLFARRGFNIESLVVAPTEDDTISRLTIMVDQDSAPIEQIVKQTDKLINVVEIADLAPGDAVERELILVTVASDVADRGSILDAVADFAPTVIDSSDSHVMLSFSGRPARVEDFENILRAYEIVDLQRTGRVALPHLS